MISKGEKADEWEIIGNDPQFLVDLTEPLLPGMYRMRLLGFSADDALMSPVLYFDRGEGFSEGDTISLRIRKIGASYQAAFELPAVTSRLRFDPGVTPGTFLLKDVTLRRISSSFHRLRRIVSTASNRMDTPRKAWNTASRSLDILRAEGVSGLMKEVERVSSSDGDNSSPGQRTYEEWIRLYDSFSPDDLRAMRDAAEKLEIQPLISVVMPTYNPPENLLVEAIESVRAQVYSNWQLCIADDCSTDPHVREVLTRYMQLDDRICVTFRETNGHISAASNSALEIVRGEWIALLDHDDILRPHALYEIVQEIARHPESALIYSDEDKISEAGDRFDPFFKPDFSLELLRSQNYFNHLTVHKTDNIRRIGGWRKGYEGSQDYDLNLRLIEGLHPDQIRHIPKILYHWRAVAGSTAASGSEKSYAYDAGFRALKDHAARIGEGADVVPIENLPFYNYRYAVPTPAPLVSLIIPTRDKVELVRGCVSSILEKTEYKNYEIIIVDNGSVEPETKEYFESLQSIENIHIIDYDKPFNYSAINNYAVQHSNGTIVGLINNDIEVISPGWLTEMVSLAVQPSIGCVGAKLYYGNDTVQHAGVVVGVGGVANHFHLGAKRYSDFGYFGRLRVRSNVTAVTGACLLIDKRKYLDIGGLDETNLKVAFNDVDLCLKSLEAGYLNVVTPFAELYHLESVSRGAEDTPEKKLRFSSEVEFMKLRWKDKLNNDAYYNLNFSLDSPDFSLAFPPRVRAIIL
ncbi:glycosyltransferase family 2 protein [Limoniibacter endophyticus]|uniref:glycosyltransferase family 2 protein n=1 Tax=Limoniibacter endophyticus TaxID=1565040 RepID=UPI001AEDBD0D|nr:glycosyltransferase [Limoniibacter endophyticus]